MYGSRRGSEVSSSRIRSCRSLQSADEGRQSPGVQEVPFRFFPLWISCRSEPYRCDCQLLKYISHMTRFILTMLHLGSVGRMAARPMYLLAAVMSFVGIANLHTVAECGIRFRIRDGPDIESFAYTVRLCNTLRSAPQQHESHSVLSRNCFIVTNEPILSGHFYFTSSTSFTQHISLTFCRG